MLTSEASTSSIVAPDTVIVDAETDESEEPPETSTLTDTLYFEESP